MLSRLVDLHGYATAEITDCDSDGPRLVVSNERCESISLTIESARLLYGALRQFDNDGLLTEAK